MAFSWTRDPVVDQFYKPTKPDVTDIYTAINEVRTNAGLEVIEVPTLSNIVYKSEHDAVRTALTNLELVASGTSYMVHNNADSEGYSCEVHDSVNNATKDFTYESVARVVVTCGSNYATVLSTNFVGYDSSVYSN